MLKRSALVFVLALTPAVSGFAQAAPAAQPPAGVYTIEPHHTQVLFGIKHMGFSTFYGSFSGASGTLKLIPGNPGLSQLDVSVPTASVTTINDTLNGELRSADWLDATAFPTMTFHSTKITVTGPDTADVTGDLTLHGATHSETLQAKLNTPGVNPMDKAYTVGFEVSGNIKRSDFGVKKYVPLVSDDVQLIISAPFEHKVL
jgi:polyisoprenoid-binding protein YceI